MFFDRYYNLCKEIGSSPSAIGKKIGISSSTVTQWKQGSIPKADALEKISSYFNVSIDYLLGKTDIKNKPTTNSGELEEMDLLTKEIMETISKLSPEGQKLALSQLRALLGFEEKKDK